MAPHEAYTSGFKRGNRAARDGDKPAYYFTAVNVRGRPVARLWDGAAGREVALSRANEARGYADGYQAAIRSGSARICGVKEEANG